VRRASKFAQNGAPHAAFHQRRSALCDGAGNALLCAWENFIFDLDGTLVDSLPGIEASVRVAISGPVPGLRPLIGPPIREILRHLSVGLTEAELDGVAARFRRAYDAGGWRNTVLQTGAAEALAGIRARGWRAFLVTNKPALATSRILATLRIRRYFSSVWTRDSRTPAFGSKAEMIADLVARQGLDPARCVMVGDTAEDYLAATQTGIQARIVGNGYGASGDVPAACRISGLWKLGTR
jgi:phosphoglycolate phosphatase